jgi:KaiC/GvpD/RAD55 family RecA-like ATPase
MSDTKSKEMGDMMYVNIRETVNSKPRLIPDTENLQNIITHTTDWYRSLYKYTEEQKKKIEETGTVSGIRDTLTDILFFDFDSKNDIEKARTDALEVANRLLEAGFTEESIGCYFTGSKGFSLEVQIDDLLTPDQFKAITATLAGDLETFDTVVSDPNRIVRIAGTKHNKSGLYKIPLTPEELAEASLDEIKVLAKYPRVLERQLQVANFPQQLKESVVEKKVETISKELTFDISTIDMKARPPRIDEARWLLQNGFFRTGERNHAMLCLASTYRNLNYPQDVTRGMMLGTAKMQSERTGEHEFPEHEIELIINQVYGIHWKGGQFTTKDPTNWLAKYAIKMGIVVKDEDKGPMLITDVEEEFTDYVKNIEKNTVLTGIEFIDRKMPITLGTNVAIVGAPGSGKTTLALNILKNCSAKDMTVVFASLDMPRKRMFEKIMYDVTGLNRVELYEAFKQGRGKDLTRKMKEQYGSVWFYDKTGTKPEQIAEYVKEVEAHTGTKVRLVMIDYLERVGSDKSSDTEASKDVASKIQDLVMDLDVAAITLVQPSKAAYAGGPDTPIESMSAIKGSSYLQQSYRNILSLWRPGYDPNLTEYDKFMEFAILKNDLGELGKAIMGFDGAKGRIRNLEDFEYSEYKELMQLKRQMKSEDGNDGWN